MNLQVLLEKGKPRILLQALLVRYGGLLPLHRVGEFSWHHSLGYGCQVEHPRGVRRDVDFDHLVPVVVYVKVGVQEELHTLILIHLGGKRSSNAKMEKRQKHHKKQQRCRAGTTLV